MGMVLAADRVTKYIVERYTPDDFRHVLIPNVAWLVHSTNRGMAFGIFADSRSRFISLLLIGTAIGVVFLLGWLLLTGRAGEPPAPAGGHSRRLLRALVPDTGAASISRPKHVLCRPDRRWLSAANLCHGKRNDFSEHARLHFPWPVRGRNIHR